MQHMPSQMENENISLFLRQWANRVGLATDHETMVAYGSTTLTFVKRNPLLHTIRGGVYGKAYP